MDIKFIGTTPGSADTPVEPMAKHLPAWYRNTATEFGPPTATNLTKTGGTTFTIRGCVPVLDYMSSGYLIRCPDKVVISAQPTQVGPQQTDVGRGCTFYSNNPDILKYHAHGQCPIVIEGEKKLYIKFNPGWIVQTPPGYSCYYYQPEFFLEERFKLLPGVVDTDQFNFEPVQFPGYLTKKESEFVVDVGTPLMAVFPFKRIYWKSEVTEDVDFMTNKENASRFRRFNGLLYRKYKQFCHQHKKYR